MSLPALYYNSITIPLWVPNLFRALPRVPSNINTTLKGHVETIVTPRVDIAVRAEFPINKDPANIRAIQNWFMWAQQGNDWAFAYDAAKVVNTTVTTNAAAGAGSVIVASATGIVSGQTYKLINGPYYQLVLVSSVASTTIGFATTPLNFPFQNGAIFRDPFYFPGVFRQAPDYPILLRPAGISTWPTEMPFDLILDFMEKID